MGSFLSAVSWCPRTSEPDHSSGQLADKCFAGVCCSSTSYCGWQISIGGEPIVRAYVQSLQTLATCVIWGEKQQLLFQFLELGGYFGGFWYRLISGNPELVRKDFIDNFFNEQIVLMCDWLGSVHIPSSFPSSLPPPPLGLFDCCWNMWPCFVKLYMDDTEMPVTVDVNVQHAVSDL